MTTSAATKPLVVIALDASEREDYAIELAGILAQTDAPELLGLFVENTRLLEHAGSRWAREILLTGSERALERGALERELRSQATSVRARFEAVSARLGLRHRFEVARGETCAEPIKRAASAEALVVSLAQAFGSGLSAGDFLRQLVAAPVPRVLLARQGWLTGRTITVLVNGVTPAADLALDAAARIAGQSGSPLIVLIPATDDDVRTAIVQRVTQALQSRDIGETRLLQLSGAAMTGVAQAALACRARLLVMPSPADPEDSAALDTLLGRFPGALMLVQA
jgi:hypothetical protein